MSTLHELVTTVNDLTSAIIAADGELTPEIEASLKAVDLAVADKVDAYAGVISRLEAEAAYWAEQSAIRAKVSKAMLQAAAYRKDAIKGAMIAMGRTEVEGHDVRFKLQNASQKRLVINEANLPPCWLMTVSETVPDKDRIKAALEAGEAVVGAKLEQGQYVRPYLNRSKK